MMSKIASSRRKGGFTLIEIMIVVLIIGILLAIAIPNFVRAREVSRAKSCVSNLKQIQSAKEQWAMDTKADSAGVPGEADLYGGDLYIKVEPLCPSSGTYTIGSVADDPTCDYAGTVAPHVLEEAGG